MINSRAQVLIQLFVPEGLPPDEMSSGIKQPRSRQSDLFWKRERATTRALGKMAAKRRRWSALGPDGTVLPPDPPDPNLPGTYPYSAVVGEAQRRNVDECNIGDTVSGHGDDWKIEMKLQNGSVVARNINTGDLRKFSPQEVEQFTKVMGAWGQPGGQPDDVPAIDPGSDLSPLEQHAELMSPEQLDAFISGGHDLSKVPPRGNSRRQVEHCGHCPGDLREISLAELRDYDTVVVVTPSGEHDARPDTVSPGDIVSLPAPDAPGEYARFRVVERDTVEKMVNALCEGTAYGAPGGASRISPEEFAKIAKNPGDPYAPLTSSDEVYYGFDGPNISLFLFNTLFNFTPEEFQTIQQLVDAKFTHDPNEDDDTEDEDEDDYSPGDEIDMEKGDQVKSSYGELWITGTGVVGDLWTSHDRGDVASGRGRGLRYSYVTAVRKQGKGRWIPVNYDRESGIYAVSESIGDLGEPTIELEKTAGAIEAAQRRPRYEHSTGRVKDLISQLCEYTALESWDPKRRPATRKAFAQQLVKNHKASVSYLKQQVRKNKTKDPLKPGTRKT